MGGFVIMKMNDEYNSRDCVCVTISQTGFQLVMHACKATVVQDGRQTNSSTNEDAHKHIYIVKG